VNAAPDNDGTRILSAAPAAFDARIIYGSDANQFAELRLPSSRQRSPLLLFIHGGYWRARYNLVHAGHLCAAFARAGVASLNLEYRRVGNAGGGWPGTFDDVAAAARYVSQNAASLLSRFGINASRFAVAGHSAGGALALWLAARDSTVKGAASLAGVNDLHRAWELHLSHDAVVELLGGTPQQVAEHYAEADPMQLAVKTRQLIIHGSDDAVVPADLSSGYVAAKSKAGEQVELISLSGAGHFDLVDPASAAWTRVQQALLSLIAA